MMALAGAALGGCVESPSIVWWKAGYSHDAFLADLSACRSLAATAISDEARTYADVLKRKQLTTRFVDDCLYAMGYDKTPVDPSAPNGPGTSPEPDQQDVRAPTTGDGDALRIVPAGLVLGSAPRTARELVRLPRVLPVADVRRFRLRVEGDADVAFTADCMVETADGVEDLRLQGNPPYERTLDARGLKCRFHRGQGAGVLTVLVEADGTTRTRTTLAGTGGVAVVNVR